MSFRHKILGRRDDSQSGQVGDEDFDLEIEHNYDYYEGLGTNDHNAYSPRHTFEGNGNIPLSFLRRDASTYSQGVNNEDADAAKSLIMNSYKEGQYRFSRYIPRTILNVFGPSLLLVFYIFIVKFYLVAPTVNGIIPKRPIESNIVFYGWWLINIFVLDWAKSAIAGLEAAALMQPFLAPRDARQLMWHTDRGWGSVTGWLRAIKLGGIYAAHIFTGDKSARWIGPSGLWFYLAFSSMLLYIAIPLSGLSMNQATALQEGGRRVDVTGVNQTTFDARAVNSIAEQIGASWRQGRITSPQDPTILYAPQGVLDVSATYYEDFIQDIYQKDLSSNDSMLENRSVTIFSGPEISERSYGRAWGFLTTISCAPAHPYTGLRLLNVTSVNNWTYHGPGFNVTSNMDKSSFGISAIFFDAASTLGVYWNYVLATDDDTSGVTRDYTDNLYNQFPKKGNVELVMWQGFEASDTTNKPDQTFLDLPAHPMVVSSKATDNITYLGYAVRCTAESNVGYATLSATTNTFSDFMQEPSSPSKGLRLTPQITWYPGVMNMTALAYAAISNLFLGWIGNDVNCETGFSTLCNGWASANAATGGVPIISEGSKNFQPPTISPERMSLAMYKLLGQVAIKVMGTGPGNWTCCSGNDTSANLGLFALDPVNDLVAGVVSYQVVLVILSLWFVITVGPQLYPPLLRRRWAEILDGFAMFRLGAEWTDAVHKINGVRIHAAGVTNALEEVPGMVGDMNLAGAGVPGFVGLSRRIASTDRTKTYTYHAQGT